MYCIEKLENVIELNDKFDFILLDHDLEGKVYVDVEDKNTGSEVARWINKNPEKIQNAFVITHTFNADGANNILSLLPNARYFPAIWKKLIFHGTIRMVRNNGRI